MTGAAVGIEQAAGNIGRQNSSGVFVFKFHEAAPSAAITEAFPFLVGQFGQCFRAPEWRVSRIGHEALVMRATVRAW